MNFSMNFFNDGTPASNGNEPWGSMQEERLSLSEIQRKDLKLQAKQMEDQSKTTSQAGADGNARAQLGSTENSSEAPYLIMKPAKNKKSLQNQKKKKKPEKRAGTKPSTKSSKKRKTSDNCTKPSLNNMLKSMNNQTEGDESEDEDIIKYEKQKWSCEACGAKNTNEGSYCINLIEGKVCGANKPSKIDPKGWGETFKDQRPTCSACTTPLKCRACGK